MRMLSIVVPVALISMAVPAGGSASEADPLTQALREKAEASAGKVPSEKQRIMLSAIEALEQSGQVEKVIKTGAQLPDGTFLKPDGEETTLSAEIGESPAIIAFYRGGWCPYCNIQLYHYQQALPQIQEMGAKLIAISPETPDNSLSTVQKNELEFTVLSDPGNRFGEELGLVFSLPGDLKDVYKDFGINLEAANGDSEWELPLAATFVVDKERKIRYRFVDVDYKKRAGVDELLSALKSASSE